MAFEWPRIHKWEENIIRDIEESVQEYVFEYYGVDEVSELTADQIAEVQEFFEGEHEGSIMSAGFYTLLNWWENEEQ